MQCQWSRRLFLFGMADFLFSPALNHSRSSHCTTGSKMLDESGTRSVEIKGHWGGRADSTNQVHLDADVCSTCSNAHKSISTRVRLFPRVQKHSSVDTTRFVTGCSLMTLPIFLKLRPRHLGRVQTKFFCLALPSRNYSIQPPSNGPKGRICGIFWDYGVSRSITT